MTEQDGSGRDGVPGVQSVGKTPRRRRYGVDLNPYADVEKDTLDGKRGMDASSRHGRVQGDSGSGLAAVQGQASVSELERGLAVANPGLFGSVLSVAKTPIRVAAGLMTKVSALGGYFTSPRSSGQVQRAKVDLMKDKEKDVVAGSSEEDVAVAEGVEDGAGKGGEEHMVSPDRGLRSDIGQGRSVKVSPEKSRTPMSGAATEIEEPVEEARTLTPYDNVLELLKGGKTPIQFPTPRSRQRQDANVLPRRALQSSFASPSPSKGPAGGSMELGGSRLGSTFRMQGIRADDKRRGETPGNGKMMGKFTFEATRAAMVKETRGMTPGSGIGSGMKPFFSGTAGPNRARAVSASPAPAFAWSPMQSPSPASASVIVEGSKKRKANGFGSTPSMDEGSVSLLDMQRRRRFKPSDDPGSTGRRSWRAGRTPYQSMMGSYSRLKPISTSPQESLNDFTPTVPITTDGNSPQRPTSDTARRILATLDSMEETAKRSKESISPLEASRYAMSAKPSPPPGASLGSFVPEKKTGSLDESQQGSLKPFALSQANVSFATPTTEADRLPGSSKKKRKSKRRASNDHPEPVSSKPPLMAFHAEKTPENIFKKAALEIKTSSEPEIFDKKILDYQFGTRVNDLRVKVAEATKSVDLGGLGQVPTDVYLFGKDKKKMDHEKPSSGLSTAPEVSKPTEKEPEKELHLSITEQKPDTLISKPAPLLASSGWGSDFLKKNAESAATAKEAIEKEVQKDAEPEVMPPKITFGVPSVVSAPGAEEAKVQPPPEAVPQAPSGWGSDFLKMNAESAAAAKEAIEKEVRKDAEPEVKPPKITFGVPSVVSAPGAEEAKVQPPPEAVSPAPSGWGSDFLKMNAESAAAAKEAIEKEVQKDAEPEVKPPKLALGSAAAEERKSSAEDQQQQLNFSVSEKQGVGEMRPSILEASQDLVGTGSKPEMDKHQDTRNAFPFSVPAPTGFGNTTVSEGFSLGGKGLGNKEEKHKFVFGAQHASSEPARSSGQVHTEDSQKAGFDSQSAQVANLSMKAPSASSSGVGFGSITPSFDFGASATQSSKSFVFGASSSGPAPFEVPRPVEQFQTVSAASNPSMGSIQFGAAPMKSFGTSGALGSGVGASSSLLGVNGPPTSSEPKFSFPPVTQAAPTFGAAQPSSSAFNAGFGFSSQQPAPTGGFASGFGSSNQQVSNVPFAASSSSTMWNATGPASFTPSFNQTPANSGFGAPASGVGGFASASNAFNSQSTFGTQSSGGFGAGMGGFGASPFPQPSAPGQMIPNDNPFGAGVPSAGGFSLGSAGNSQSEGRRKVKVKRRNRN